MASGLSLLGAGLLLISSVWPALGAYFFGENFIFLGQYRANGSDFWRGLLSAHDGIWFRPGSFAAELPWNLYLPPVPLWYHLRNLAFAALALFLLHRLLCRLVASTAARLVALLFFAGSKVHLTLIGYINLLGSIIILIALLASLLAFHRYMHSRRWWDYALGVVCCWYCIATKDGAVVAVIIVAAFVLIFDDEFAPGQARLRYWLPRLIPLALGAMVYLVLRSQIVASAASNPVYAPRLSAEQLWLKALTFTAFWGNLSFDYRENLRPNIGAGLADVLRSTGVPDLSGAAGLALEIAAYLALWALIAATVVSGWTRQRTRLLFPIVWLLVFLVPSVATRAVQSYYFYEPLGGAAVLLGLALDRARWRLLGVWFVSIAAIATLGWASNRTSHYTWRFTADQVALLHRPVVEQLRGQPIDTLVLVSEGNLAFWNYALQQPLLPILLRDPALRVEIVDPSSPAAAVPATAQRLVLDIERGFAPWDPTAIPSGQSQAALQLASVSPNRTAARKGFNLQANGESALIIRCEGAQPTTVVVFDGVPLSTSYGNRRLLTATLPPGFYAQPGSHTILLRDGERESDPLEFTVEP